MAKYQNISESKAVRIGSIAPRRPKSKKEEQEFGLAQKEYILCPKCESVFFHKSWHRKLEEDIKHLREDKRIKFSVCPACQMAEEKVFEGEIVLSLGNKGTAAKKDILNLIRNSDEQARERDTQDRVLWIEDNSSEIKVFTSENQLAVRIGKKLESAFSGSKLEIKHSEEEDIVRVYWEY